LHDPLALVAIGRMSRHEHQQRCRQELNQSDHAEIERAAGQLIDLPSDGDCGDLAGEPRESPGNDEQQKRGMPEQSAGADGHQGRHGWAGFLLIEA